MEQEKVPSFVQLHSVLVLVLPYERITFLKVINNNIKKKVLGRAKHEHEFIKNNNPYSVIEIELKGEKKNYVIKRRITAKEDGHGSTSDWWIDGMIM